MPVQEQKAAPRVHRVPPKEQKPTEDTAPVAVAVTLDSIKDEATTEQELADLTIENNNDLETEEEEEEEEETEGRLLGERDDDEGDEDLSLLEDDSSPMSRQNTVVAQEEPEEGFLEIYSEDCLSCKSLVPTAKKKFKPCHFSAGNTHCPASQTQIVIRVPLEQIVPRFMAAEKANDFNRLSRLTAKLASFPDWYQARVAQALRDAREKKT